MLNMSKKTSSLMIKRCMYCNKVYGFYRGTFEISLRLPVAGHLAKTEESIGICPIHAPIAIAAALQDIDFFTPLSHA